jgi:KUP system potassium uptake protein
MARASARLPLTVAALGIVFGDIGTSPLYAFREAATAAPDLAAASVLGVLSLIVWAIVLSVGVKYVGLVLRLDNDGEGGVLALATLLRLNRREDNPSRWLVVVALVGAAMLFGDGVITPAISVLSAVEGLEFAVPSLTDYVVPLTVAVLAGFYLSQRAGTHRIGALFGPVMLVWFVVLAALGIAAIAGNPDVLTAFDPRHGIRLLASDPARAGIILAAVFLAITGGEALYADLGQFGRPVIARAWFFVAMPALVLNYFGQGALVLADHDALRNPFYLLAPGFLQLPLLVLATVATVIASQAVVTGVFSLAKQAMVTGFLVPLGITHTADENESHVYIGSLNVLLAVLSIATVLGFRSSDALSDAYGLAVATAMITTTVLFVAAQIMLRRWSLVVAVATGAALLVLDLAFFLPNTGKIETGGWLPVSLAAVAFLAMWSWRFGTARTIAILDERARDLADETALFDAATPTVERPVAFLSRSGTSVPVALARLNEQIGAVFSRAVVVSVRVLGKPRVSHGEQTTVERLGARVARVELRVGYMQIVDLPAAIAPRLRELGIDPAAVVYVTGAERPLMPARIRSASDVLWAIFVVQQRNGARGADRFALPPERTLDIGYRIAPGGSGGRGRTAAER